MRLHPKVCPSMKICMQGLGGHQFQREIIFWVSIMWALFLISVSIAIVVGKVLGNRILRNVCGHSL